MPVPRIEKQLLSKWALGQIVSESSSCDTDVSAKEDSGNLIHFTVMDSNGQNPGKIY